MATNKMTEEERRSITQDIHTVLQRPRGILTWPLAPEELVALWESRFNPGVVSAVHALVKTGYVTMQWAASPSVYMGVDVGGTRYQIHASGSSPIFIDARGCENDKPMEVMDVARIVGDARTHVFVNWIHESIGWQRATEFSLGALADLLGQCNTVGQLARMAPDLVPFLSSDKQSICRGQTKASRLPESWASFPREPVHEMLMHVARCGLLPEIGFSHSGITALGYTGQETYVRP